MLFDNEFLKVDGQRNKCLARYKTKITNNLMEMRERS
jgi:hypothetical protein